VPTHHPSYMVCWWVLVHSCHHHQHLVYLPLQHEHKSPSTTHHQPCMQMYPLHLKSRLTMPRHLKGSLPCDLHIHQYLMILWKVYFMIHLVLFIGLACNTHSWGVTYQLFCFIREARVYISKLQNMYMRPSQNMVLTSF
jgi:hypothetical protein